jgi:hypothetical protein
MVDAGVDAFPGSGHEADAGQVRPRDAGTVTPADAGSFGPLTNKMKMVIVIDNNTDPASPNARSFELIKPFLKAAKDIPNLSVALMTQTCAADKDGGACFKGSQLEYPGILFTNKWQWGLQTNAFAHYSCPHANKKSLPPFNQTPYVPICEALWVGQEMGSKRYNILYGSTLHEFLLHGETHIYVGIGLGGISHGKSDITEEAFKQYAEHIAAPARAFVFNIAPIKIGGMASPCAPEYNAKDSIVTKMGGTIFDFCAENWTPFFQEMLMKAANR